MFFVTQNRSEILKNSQLLAVRLSGYALVLINEVAIRRAQLVPGWITVFTGHTGLLRLAILSWVEVMSTSELSWEVNRKNT